MFLQNSSVKYKQKINNTFITTVKGRKEKGFNCKI